MYGVKFKRRIPTLYVMQQRRIVEHRSAQNVFGALHHADNRAWIAATRKLG